MPGGAVRRNYRIDLGYDGTDFWGSQRQPGVRTVQQTLENALERLTSSTVHATFAGRTDRGVHAVGQVASAHLSWRRDVEGLRRGLAALTPDDIVIYGVEVADDAFHARFSARRREYRYRLWRGPSPPLLSRKYVWQERSDLDIKAMREASTSLVGRHDFSSFAGAGAGVPGSVIDCVRTLFAVELVSLDQTLDPMNESSRMFELRVTGNGFLPHMVRNIMGDLVAIGRGEQSSGWLQELLEARDRRLGAPPAPPAGLVLWRVEYDEDRSRRRDLEGVSGKRGEADDEDILAEGVRDPA